MKKSSLLFLTLSSFVALGALVIGTKMEEWSRVEGEGCPHTGQIDKYDAVAPTKVELGNMAHFACCDCHTAWSDHLRSNEIGNTVTNRSKIDINMKTIPEEISRDEISVYSGLFSISEEAPYVVGLDQTDWTIANGGVGGGTYSFYNIDGMEAIRISTETISAQQYSILDNSSNGYSSFRIEKELSSGNVTISFDYKMYNLSTSSYADEPSMYAVLEGDNHSEIIELDFVTDNTWQKFSFTSTTGFNFRSCTIKMHRFRGEMYLANLNVASSGFKAPNIEAYGAGVRFGLVAGADYYLVHDNNNNPSEIRFETSDAKDGMITYRAEAAGKHDIYVTAHSNDTTLGYSKSLVISDIETAPTFFYDNFANEYYVKDYYFTDKYKPDGAWISKSYDTSDINDASGWDTTLSSGYRHAYYTDNNSFTQDANQRMRYNSTAANGNLARIVSEAKELGTNVLLLSHNDSFIGGTQTLEENQELKTIMDYAYANNLKVIVMSNSIYHASANGPDEATIKTTVRNYLSNFATSLIQHPAFYGFTLRDEPTNNEQDIYYVSWAAKAVKDYFAENYVSKKLAVECPFFVSALLQQGNGETFCCDANYMMYVETWITITGLDYYSTDIYTYTTQVYNTSSFNGSSTGEVIDLNYNIYMKLKNKYKGLKLHLTTTSNNDAYMRAACNQYDVYGSTLYAAALNNYGISRFTYFPAIWTYHWKNGVVNRDGSHTTKYDWVKGAQSQFELIQDKLYGFEPTSISHSVSGGYNASSTNNRIMDVTLTRGEETARMVVNYNSQTNKTHSYSVAIPSGKAYYLFGNGVDTSAHVSTGENVSLTHGQAVLITSEDLTGNNVAILNEMIANANDIKLKSNVNYSKFALLANEIDTIYNSLSFASKNKVVGYDTYLENKQNIQGNATILYDQTFNYYENSNDTKPVFEKVIDSTLGEMNVMDFASPRNVMQLWLETNLVGEDWSELTTLGFFLKSEAPITDNAFLNVNNVWGAIMANISVVDASQNLYFYNFDLSSITAPFTVETQFEIYFGSNISHVEISNFVNITRFEIASPITAANKGGQGAWSALDTNNNGEKVWEKSYSTMGLANRTYVDPTKYTDVVLTFTNTCDVNLYVACWGGAFDWFRVKDDLNVGTTISFSFSVDVWNNGETIYMDCYEIGNDSSSKGSAVISLECVYNKDFTKYTTALAEMNSLSLTNRSDIAKFVLRQNQVDALLNELSDDEKNGLNGYNTYVSNKATVAAKSGILYSGGYKCVNDGAALSTFNDNVFGTMHRHTDPQGTQANSRELSFSQELQGTNWGEYSYMGMFVRYDHTVSDGAVFLPDNNWGYTDWGTQSRGATLIDSSTNLYYYEWPINYLSAFTNNNSAICFYFAGGGALVAHTLMEVTNIVYFN